MLDLLLQLNEEFGDLTPRKPDGERTCDPDRLEELRVVMKREIDKGQKAYPQYSGHFDKWVVGKIKKSWEGKGGVGAEVGDLVLISPQADLPDYDNGGMFRTTFFSMRLGWSCVIKVNDVDVL